LRELRSTEGIDGALISGTSINLGELIEGTSKLTVLGDEILGALKSIPLMEGTYTLGTFGVDIEEIFISGILILGTLTSGIFGDDKVLF
jgi:hypothetical protein